MGGDAAMWRRPEDFRLRYERNTVVIIDRPRARRVRPVPAVVVAVPRGSFELLLGYSGAVAAQSCVVFQRLPGQRVVLVAHAQKPAEAQDRVGNLAADLVDHDPLDGSDLLIVRTINRGSLDLVTADQISGLS